MEIRERYTHGHHASVVRTHAWRTVENSAAYLIPHLRNGLTILDMGSGPGTISIDFARRVGSGSVVGIDSSAEIVAAATERARQEGVPNVRFETGDLYSTGLPDASFDVVHAHQVLQHVGDPVAALVEMKRLVKPGGIVAVREVDYGGSIWSPPSAGLTDWMDVLQDVSRRNGGEPNAGRVLKSWALAAGFAEVTSTASVWCFSSDEERSWWGGNWAERALVSDYAVHAREYGIADDARLQAVSEAWSDWASDPVGWYAMPHGEIIARP